MSIELSTLQDRVRVAIAEASDDLLALARFIHAHPELALEEHQAAARCVELLRKYGFEVQTGVANLPTAFVGRQGKGRPAVGILAEYDALAGVGHGCGHNLIAGSAVGAAIGLARVIGDTGGSVVAFGTPAEEVRGGKVYMVNAGLFAEVDATLGIHPYDAEAEIPLEPGSGKGLACRAVEVEFFGHAAHASMDPHNGVNALNAVIETFNGVNALRQHCKPSVRMHGVILDGGHAVNVVPDYAKAEFLLRAETRGERDELVEKLRAIANGAAMITGARLEFTPSQAPYDEIVNSFVITRRMKVHFDAVGLAVKSEQPGPGLASSDIGNVSQVVPTGSAFYPICDTVIPWHSPEAAAASNTEQAYRAMLLAAQVVAWTALDLLCDPVLLEQAKAEHQATLAGCAGH